MEIFIILGVVVLITHFLEGITGFGCTVLALPFAIYLIGTKSAVPVLAFLALLLALYIVIIDFKKIVWAEFGKIILYVSIGLPIGIYSFSYLNEKTLKYILGVFMVIVAIRGLINLSQACAEGFISKPILKGMLIVGGFIHGAFASGGPLVVIYAKKALPDKSNFRATICMLWASLNTVMVGQMGFRGILTNEIWTIIGVCMPFLIVGAWAGNWAHHHIRDNHFSKVVYGVLLIAGLLMFK